MIPRPISAVPPIFDTRSLWNTPRAAIRTPYSVSATAHSATVA
jgi:hypothetical protein